MIIVNHAQSIIPLKLIIYSTIFPLLRRLFTLAVTYCATLFEHGLFVVHSSSIVSHLLFSCPFRYIALGFPLCLLFVTFGRPQASTFVVGSPAIPPSLSWPSFVRLLYFRSSSVLVVLSLSLFVTTSPTALTVI